MFIIMVNLFPFIYKMVPIASKAEKIVDSILSSNAVKYRDSFRERFSGVSSLVGTNYSGSLTIATLGLVNEARHVFGEAQAIITIYEKCKVMLLPMPSYQIFVGLTVERSPETEEKEESYNIVNKIERLVADTF